MLPQYEPDALTLFAFVLLVGLPAIASLGGVIYWLIVADLNLELLSQVGRRLIASGDASRLLKIARTTPRSPMLSVLARGLTFDLNTLPRTDHPGGYRVEQPIDRDVLIRADLRAHGRELSAVGRLLWWCAAAGVLPAVGAFALFGPWSERAESTLWWCALAALAVFSALTLARARVERKIEAAVEFVTPHAGLLAHERRP